MREFHLSLYFEHLEEASFLWEQRRALGHTSDLPWPELQSFEDRLEAHLDALVVGGELALEACTQRLLEGDAGEVFAALSVACRQQRSSLLSDVWRTLDFDDPLRVQAVTDALKFELPAAWIPACEQALVSGDARIVPILSAACGYRRLPLQDAIATRALAEPNVATAPVLSSLSRLPVTERSRLVLEAALREPDAIRKAQAIEGLLRLDGRALVSHLNAHAFSEDWPQLALGLAGDRTSATVLRRRLDAGNATTQTLTALALLGDLSTVRSLCTALTSDELGDSAALALYWITGAPLFEDAFVPEAVDERELFAHELHAFQHHGQMPQRADGAPYGSSVRALVRDVTVWNQWLAANANQFVANVRYRNGQPYTAQVVLSCLLNPLASRALRELAHAELLIRFGCPVRFETDARVAEQMAALHEIARWLEQDAPARTAGTW
jgi:hypothetical protein